MLWHIQLFLAHMGFFKAHGVWWIHQGPKGQVLYPDGNYSAPMALGNCVEYAAIFRGKVVKVNRRGYNR